MKNYYNKKILITGSNGFLGKIISDEFKIFKPLLIDKSYIKKKRNKFNIDLTNFTKLEKFFFKFKPDLIIHLASEIFDLSDEEVYNKNLVASKNIIKLSEKYKVKKIIFTSTFSLFERNYKNLIRETTKPSALNAYALSKHKIEKLLIQSNISTTIFRLPIILSETRAHRMAVFFELIKNDLPIFLFGNGNNKLHFVSSKMICYCIKNSLNSKESEIYNLGVLSSLNLKTMFTKSINHLNSKSKVIILPISLIRFLFKILSKIKFLDFNNYHLNIFSSNIVLDISKAKKKFKLKKFNENNFDLFINSYKYYVSNYKYVKKIKSGSNKIPDMKIINFLKIFKYFF